MQVYYKILKVLEAEKTIPAGYNYKTIEKYKFQSPEHYQLDQQFDSEPEAQVAIEKYGNSGELYIIQKFYKIPYI